jgi:hypothetical protein
VRVLAAAGAPGPTLRLTPQVAAPGEPVRVDLISGAAWTGPAEVQARMGGHVLRLLPAAVAGTLIGVSSAPEEPGVSAVSVRVGGCGPTDAACVLEAPLLVAPDAPRPRVSAEAIRTGVETGGGVVVESRGLDRLREHLLRRTPRRPAAHVWFPMRSAWWLLPFGACLGAEWLLRRRAGLR